MVLIEISILSKLALNSLQWASISSKHSSNGFSNSVLIYGHLHIPFIKKIETNLYINPGSISLPKEDNPPSYLFYDEEQFIIYDINDNIIVKKEI